MLRHTKAGAWIVAVCLFAGTAVAQVVVETVPVGAPGNPGEMSGQAAGGSGTSRVCGAVDHVYSIGKFEITAGQYTAFLNAVAASDSYGLYDLWMHEDHGCWIERQGSPGTYTYTVAPDWANRPVNRVSWGDAARFANWLHNGQPTGPQNPTTTENGSYALFGAVSLSALGDVVRQPNATWVIPTEDEWYKAAYHKNDGVTGNYFDYPTSSDVEPGNLVIEPDPGNNVNWVVEDYCIGSPYWRTEVGEFENSSGPYGTYDQGGNVFEWTESRYENRLDRALRGGSYIDAGWAVGAAYRYWDMDVTESGSNYIGFRLGYVPEPSALVLLLGLGALAPLRRR